MIGANPASNHPRFIHKLKACRDRGGKVVVINPAKEAGLVKFALPKSPRSLLKGGSEIASHYLQPNIASDLFVFKGIAKALIERDALKLEFIEEFTLNFDEFLSDIEQLDWADIEKATGLQRSEIESVAEVYQESTKSVFAWGMGMTHHQHGVQNVEYISNIALLRGMVGTPGAGLLPLRGHSNVQGIGTIGVKPVLPRDVFSAMETELGVKLSNDKQGMDTLACLEAADDHQINNALIMGGNLYSASPNTEWVEQAIDKIDFKLFLTTTLNQGHLYGADNSESLILPVKARDEESQATTQESMFNYVRLSDGGIKRIEHARSEVSILVDIFAKVLQAEKRVGRLVVSDFAKHTTIRRAISKIVPGLQELDDIEVAKKEFHIRNRIMHKPVFNTPSGKAEFVVHNVSMPVSKKRHFKLMSVRSEGQFNSIIYEQNDSYREIDQRWAVMMNSSDMQALQLVKHDLVDIKSETGQMSKVLVYPYDIPQGNVMAYYPEANVLIGTERDPRSQTPAFKSVDVSIKKTQL